MRLLNVIFGILVLAPHFKKTILEFDEPSLINHFRISCYEQFTKLQLCFPIYERCRGSAPNPLECQNFFVKCIQNGTVHEYNEFCDAYLVNATTLIRTESAWDKCLNDTFYLKSSKSPNEENCHLSKQLFRKMKPNITNELIERMPSVASTFCPCGKRSGDESEGIRSSKMGTPLQMWHGGFSSKKCWREMDRYLVENICGVSVALEINHIWAKLSDCIEDPYRKENCLHTFKTPLKNSIKNSTIRNKCQLYTEMIDVYLPTYHSPSFDYKITYMNTSDLIYLQSYEHQEDRLYLINSIGESVYSTCFSNKREVSSCNYMFENCNNTRNIENCGKKWTVCLSEVKEECKKLLVQRNDNVGTIKKLWEIVTNFAKTKVLAICEKVRMAGEIWIISLVLCKIFLKISDIFDHWRDQRKSKSSGNEHEMVELQPQETVPNESVDYSNPNSMMCNNEVERSAPGAQIRDIRTGDHYNGMRNDNNDNDRTRDVEANPIEAVENEKEKEKKKEDLTLGKSFYKMGVSIWKFVRD